MNAAGGPNWRKSGTSVALFPTDASGISVRPRDLTGFPLRFTLEAMNRHSNIYRALGVREETLDLLAAPAKLVRSTGRGRVAWLHRVPFQVPPKIRDSDCHGTHRTHSTQWSIGVSHLVFAWRGGQANGVLRRIVG